MKLRSKERTNREEEWKEEDEEEVKEGKKEKRAGANKEMLK